MYNMSSPHTSVNTVRMELFCQKSLPMAKLPLLKMRCFNTLKEQSTKQEFGQQVTRANRSFHLQKGLGGPNHLAF